MHRSILVLVSALSVVACATAPSGHDPSPQQLQEAAEVRIRSATVWGLLGHAAATPVLLAVNGQPHRSMHPRLQLDDSLYLAPGHHDLAVALVGSPEGHGLAQIEGRTCLQMDAESHARYVLRGVVEQANFRLDLLRAEGDTEVLVHSQPVSSLVSADDTQPCRAQSAQANASARESLTAQTQP